jgi:hypothetical protein
MMVRPVVEGTHRPTHHHEATEPVDLGRRRDGISPVESEDLQVHAGLGGGRGDQARSFEGDMLQDHPGAAGHSVSVGGCALSSSGHRHRGDSPSAQLA